MTELMQALVYEAPSVMTMRHLSAPKPGANDVVIEVAFSGICGSELSGFLGQSSIRKPPLVFGHELSGHIVGLGEECELPVGAAVTVNPLITCGRCAACYSGRQQLCERRLLLGASLPGSNAAFVCVPQSAVTVLPAGADLRAAATVEPAAFAVHAIRLAGVAPSDSVLVVGAGAIGLFLIQVLQVWGVRDIYVAELNPDRLTMATAAGAQPVLDPKRAVESGQMPMVDLAIDAVGSSATRQACLAAVKSGGQVLLAGLHSDLTELSLNTVVRGEIVIRGAFAYNSIDFATALDWLLQGRIGLKEGVVEAPLVDGQQWFERLVAGDAASKVLLVPGRDA